ncbi:MAG TPA: alanine racemase C-terminal domain-containing protein [Humibacter sp.]|nr:alanine racemase C-terminal domain-containing protein [Humibacter sp.]
MAFDEATDRRCAQIDLGVIRANLMAYAAAARVPVLARVDHDAYGHGLLPVAMTALDAGAEWLGVADLDEAAALRQEGIGAPILVLGTASVTGDAPHRTHVAVGSAEAAVRAADAGAAGLHLALDCGGAPRAMPLAEAAALLDEKTDTPVTGLMGVHGADVSPSVAEARFAEAKRALGDDGRVTHLHGTRGVDAGFGSNDDLVRIGSGLYGLPDEHGARRGHPALRAAGRVVTVKRVRAGEGVSYGYTYRAAADGRLALVTGGYAQGIVRSLGNRASVSLNGRRCPIVGRVAMDVCVVDLDGASAAPGDEVVFLGDPEMGEPDVSEWATATGLTAAELIVRLASGFQRSHIS